MPSGCHSSVRTVKKQWYPSVVTVVGEEALLCASREEAMGTAWRGMGNSS